MWNQGESSAAGGGGFLTGSQSAGFGSSPGLSAGGGKRTDRVQNVVAVSAAAVGSCSPDEPLRVSGMEVNLALLTGRLESVDRSAVKTTYTLSDGTGSVSAVRWLDAEADSSADADDVAEGMLCRIVASVRPVKAGGVAAVRCFDIRAITPEEYQLHQLEVQHAALKIRHLETLSAGGGGSSAAGGGLANSTLLDAPGGDAPMVQGGGMSGLSPQQQLVYSVIQAAPGEEGISRTAILTSLRGRVAKPEVDQVLEFLSNEGHVYNTTDDEHFKATDC